MKSIIKSIIYRVYHLVENIGIIFTLLTIKVNSKALNSMQDQRHTDNYDDQNDDVVDDDDDDDDDADDDNDADDDADDDDDCDDDDDNDFV